MRLDDIVGTTLTAGATLATVIPTVSAIADLADIADSGISAATFATFAAGDEVIISAVGAADLLTGLILADVVTSAAIVDSAILAADAGTFAAAVDLTCAAFVTDATGEVEILTTLLAVGVTALPDLISARGLSTILAADAGVFAAAVGLTD